VVARLDQQDASRADRLLPLGATRAATILPLPMFPGIVFQCDQTELAIERAVASAILVDLASS